ncbi:hypothetical protein JTB14_035561 [Gonioctena quinquepunctata]|nr:hypothetical protein JTB14_035561 [Gonioctena quinquepunctata]
MIEENLIAALAIADVEEDVMVMEQAGGPVTEHGNEIDDEVASNEDVSDQRIRARAISLDENPIIVFFFPF